MVTLQAIAVLANLGRTRNHGTCDLPAASGDLIMKDVRNRVIYECTFVIIDDV